MAEQNDDLAAVLLHVSHTLLPRVVWWVDDLDGWTAFSASLPCHQTKGAHLSVCVRGTHSDISKGEICHTLVLFRSTYLMER